MSNRRANPKTGYGCRCRNVAPTADPAYESRRIAEEAEPGGCEGMYVARLPLAPP